MIKNYLPFPFLVTFCKFFFQEAYSLAVNNFTKLAFKILDETITAQLQVVTGSTNGMGYSILFNVNKK